MITLLNAADIARFIPDVPAYMGGCKYPFLSQVEVAIFRKCFGNDFYKALKDDLTDVSGATKWQPGPYVAGAIVTYAMNGITTYFTALENTSAIPPNEAWGLTPRFQTVCYETLWCDYLGILLSVATLRRHLPGIETEVNASGINRSESNQYNPATRNEVSNYRDYLNGVFTEILRNLDIWMKANNEEKCFDLYCGINDLVCTACGCLKNPCCEHKCLAASNSRGKYIIA